MSVDEKPLDPEQEKVIARIRRLMSIALATTFIAIAVVLGLVGYKVYRTGDTAPVGGADPALVDVLLPSGSKVLNTATANGLIIVTIELAGTTELRTFDATTLKPVARLRLLAPRY